MIADADIELLDLIRRRVIRIPDISGFVSSSLALRLGLWLRGMLGSLLEEDGFLTLGFRLKYHQIFIKLII